MASQDLDLRIQALVDAGNSAKTFGELKKNLKELNSLAVEYGDAGTEALNRITAASAKVRDRLDDIRDSTNTLKGESVERLATSFNLLSDGVGKLDFGQATIGLKSITSTVKDLNFKSLSNGLKEFTSSFLDLGKTLLTNPIFLLGAAIVLIITKFDELKAAGGLVGKVFTAIGDAIKWVIDIAKDLLDLIGLTNFAATDKAEKIKEANEKETKALTDRYDAEIALTKAAGKATEDLEIKKAQSLKNTVQKEIDAITDIKKVNGTLTPDQQKRLDELTGQWKKYTSDILVLEQQKVQNIINANKTLDTQIGDLRVKQTKSQVDDINLKRLRDIEAATKSIGDETKKAETIKLINQDADRQISEYKKQQGKEATEKNKTNLNKQLSDLQATNKLAILNTKENTDERLKVTNAGLEKEIQFYQAHGKQLGLSKEQLALKIKELQEEEKTNTKSHTDYLIDLEAKKNKAIEDLAKELEDYRKAGVADELALEETKKNTLLQSLENTGSLQLSKRNAIVNQIHNLEHDALVSRMNEELLLADGNEKKIAEIKERYRQLDLENDKKANKTKIQNYQEAVSIISNIAGSFANVLSIINDAITNSENSRLKKGEKADADVKRKQFRRKQNLEVVQANINAAAATAQIWGTYAEQPIVAAILTAIAGATFVATIAKIRSQHFDPDTASAGGSIGAVGGSSGFSLPNTSNSSSTFNAPNLYSAGSSAPLPPNGTPEVQRVVVVESDITKTQQRVNTYQQRATIFE